MLWMKRIFDCCHSDQTQDNNTSSFFQSRFLRFPIFFQLELLKHEMGVALIRSVASCHFVPMSMDVARLHSAPVAQLPLLYFPFECSSIFSQCMGNKLM